MALDPNTEPQMMHPLRVWLSGSDPGAAGEGAALLAATEMTRVADTNAYAIDDAITTTVTAGSVVPLEFTVASRIGDAGFIVGARMETNSATAFAAMRLHLFNQAPFAAAGYQGDNAALALTYTAITTGAAGTNPNYIGYIDFTTFLAFSSSAYSIGEASPTELAFKPASSSLLIYGLLQAKAAFTPASGQKFNMTLEVR